MEQSTGNPGMSPAIQAAIARRSMGPGGTQAGQGALTQMSPGAAGASQVPPATPFSEMNKASAPQAAGKAPSQKYQAQNQEDMIVEALIEQLKNSHALKKETLKVASQPQAPMASPAPSMAPDPSQGMAPPSGMPPMGGGAPMMGGDMFSPPESPKRSYFDLSMPSLSNSNKQGGYPF